VLKLAKGGSVIEDITNRINFGTNPSGTRTTIAYDVTDGGFGDGDGIANGTIIAFSCDILRIQASDFSPIFYLYFKFTRL